MAYTKLNPQPDTLGEGEVALELDDGSIVAVSVTSRWLENGAGVQFLGAARCLDVDGGPQHCPNGQHVRVTLPSNADALTVQRWGVARISKDILLTMLGEPRELVVHEDGAEPAPLKAFSPDLLSSAQIRDHIAIAKSTGTADPASLLDL